MCRPTRCRNCSNVTWAGCGRHVDQVMHGVPDEDRCTCTSDDDDSGRTGFAARISRLFRG